MHIKTKNGCLLMNRIFKDSAEAREAGYRFWFTEKGSDFYMLRYRNIDLTRVNINHRYNAHIACCYSDSVL